MKIFNDGNNTLYYSPAPAGNLGTIALFDADSQLLCSVALQYMMEDNKFLASLNRDSMPYRNLSVGAFGISDALVTITQEDGTVSFLFSRNNVNTINKYVFTLNNKCRIDWLIEVAIKEKEYSEYNG